MLIGIDGNEANVEKRVGISEYAFELINYFSVLNDPDKEFRIYLKNKPLSHMPKERGGFKYEVIGPKKMWTQFGLPFNLFFDLPKPNVFFTPSHYSPRFSPVPTVISIMDLSYIFFPELFNKNDLYQLKNWTAYSAKKASKILTISNSSRNDIIREYQVAKDKVVVTYPGIKSGMKENPDSQVLKKHGIKGEYILFVGTIQPRKNIKNLIKAFSEIYKKNKDLTLVIVGKKGWLYEEIIASPTELNIVDQVKFLDFVSDKELSGLYENALCFVLPSLYEGFGLPVLEAMKHGCPVITSNVSSLPEAGGDAALYVNPEDVSDIKEKIETLIKDKKLRDNLIKKGYLQVKKFSWEKTAKETLKVLEEVVRK